MRAPRNEGGEGAFIEERLQLPESSLARAPPFPRSVDSKSMAEEFASDQEELAQLWKRARKDGCMSPWQQAKVFALKEAWEEIQIGRAHV